MSLVRGSGLSSASGACLIRPSKGSRPLPQKESGQPRSRWRRSGSRQADIAVRHAFPGWAARVPTRVPIAAARQKQFRFRLRRAPARQNRPARVRQSSAQQRCRRAACDRRRRFQSMPNLLRCRAAPRLARDRAWTPFGACHLHAPGRQVASLARFCSASRSTPTKAAQFQ
jgi:hypothetical protein